jgi:hypothetical protein
VIIQLDSPAAGNLDQARRTLEALADSWATPSPKSEQTKHQARRPAAAIARPSTRSRSQASSCPSCPSRPPPSPSSTCPTASANDAEHKKLIDHAQHLATLQVTIYLQLPARTIELSALTPDQILDLHDDQRPAR